MSHCVLLPVSPLTVEPPATPDEPGSTGTRGLRQTRSCAKCGGGSGIGRGARNNAGVPCSAVRGQAGVPARSAASSSNKTVRRCSRSQPSRSDTKKLPAQPLADRSAGSAFEAGAGLLWDEQNCPPTPLSAKPIVCPCAKPQANTLNRTQKYNVQAMSERSERVSSWRRL